MQGCKENVLEQEEVIINVADLLESLLESFFDGEDELIKASYISPFDTIAEYTAKILSLNNDAKSKVMKVLEKYNYHAYNKTLSKEEKQRYVFDSLSGILNELDNYNTILFYE